MNHNGALFKRLPLHTLTLLITSVHLSFNDVLYLSDVPIPPSPKMLFCLRL